MANFFEGIPVMNLITQWGLAVLISTQTLSLSAQEAGGRKPNSEGLFTSDSGVTLRRHRASILK